jgi:hypothetical protein
VRFGGWPLPTQRGGEGPLSDSPWEFWWVYPEGMGPAGPRRVNGLCEAPRVHRAMPQHTRPALPHVEGRTAVAGSVS